VTLFLTMAMLLAAGWAVLRRLEKNKRELALKPIPIEDRRRRDPRERD